MDEKLIEDNTDFLIKFTLENLELLKKTKGIIDKEIVELHEFGKEKKQSIQHLIVKPKAQGKIKNKVNFENYIHHVLMEKHADSILNRFEFRVDNIIRQYNINEKYTKIVPPSEVNAKNLYVKIKGQSSFSPKELLNIQELLKEVNVPLVNLVKQYNEKISQIKASKVLLEKITLEEVTHEYIDFFLLDDEF